MRWIWRWINPAPPSRLPSSYTLSTALVIPSAARNLLQQPHLGSPMAGDSSLRSE
ncbi:MAG: hypothetical protein LBK18_03300 [Prevotellaceae bacterium]|nr:hypothetical protein [Prevotellaceae bacterium]